MFQLALFLLEANVSGAYLYFWSFQFYCYILEFMLEKFFSYSIHGNKERFHIKYFSVTDRRVGICEDKIFLSFTVQIWVYSAGLQIINHTQVLNRELLKIKKIFFLQPSIIMLRMNFIEHWKGLMYLTSTLSKVDC